MDDDYSIFLGFGSCHDLRDADYSEPKLLRCKSVSRAAAYAIDSWNAGKPRRANRIGFRTKFRKSATQRD